MVILHLEVMENVSNYKLIESASNNCLMTQCSEVESVLSVLVKLSIHCVLMEFLMYSGCDISGVAAECCLHCIN